MKFERDEWGHWSLNLSERAFITPEWEWAQLRPGYNWRTFHLAHLMFEQDGFVPGWVFEVIVLGVGFRLRANDDWTQSEQGRQLLERMDEADGFIPRLDEREVADGKSS